jgi:hypothetical protein
VFQQTFLPCFSLLPRLRLDYCHIFNVPIPQGTGVYTTTIWDLVTDAATADAAWAGRPSLSLGGRLREWIRRCRSCRWSSAQSPRLRRSGEVVTPDSLYEEHGDR